MRSFLGIITYGSLYLLEPILNTHTVFGIFAQATISTILGGIAYIVITQRLDVMESKAIATGFVKVLKYVTGRKIDGK